MPVTRTTTEHTIRQNLQAIHYRAAPPWIPACAGMTTEFKRQACVRHRQAGIMTKGAVLRGKGINRIIRAKASLTLMGNTAFDIVREFALFDFLQKRAGDGLDGFAERRVLL